MSTASAPQACAARAARSSVSGSLPANWTMSGWSSFGMRPSTNPKPTDRYESLPARISAAKASAMSISLYTRRAPCLRASSLNAASHCVTIGATVQMGVRSSRRPQSTTVGGRTGRLRCAPCTSSSRACRSLAKMSGACASSAWRSSCSTCVTESPPAARALAARASSRALSCCCSCWACCLAESGRDGHA
jgi:hypothetical protein